MLTGDNKGSAYAVADAIGIPAKHVFAEVSPDQKASIVDSLKQQFLGDKSSYVAFVGDGINDAPALATSDVALVMGTGSDVALEVGEVILERNDVCDVAVASELAEATLRKIHQNFFWALVYNLIMIPLAACGILPAAAAGACMALSSVSVVGNSLLLKRFRPKER